MTGAASLGLDFGARRIGVALSEVGLIARRHSVIPVNSPQNVLDRILTLVQQTSAAEVVVGVPYSLDGAVGPQARATLKFVDQLRRRCPVPVRTHDEALSTKIGIQTMIAEGLGRKARQQQNDAAAAQYMLQDYLNSHGRGFAFDLVKLWRLLAAVFLILVVAVGAGGFALARDTQLQLWLVEQVWSPPPAPGAPAKLITIPSGASAAQIGDLLASQGIIKDARAFRLMAARLGLSSNLESGEYRLNGGMTLSQVAAELQHGRAALIAITVPEGKRTEEVLDLIARSHVATVDQLEQAANPALFPYDFLRGAPASAGLEGYLFPDTYLVPPDIGPSATLDLFLKNFDQKLTPDLRDAVQRLGYSMRDVLTMASIVEREAVHEDERARIAGVYYNRLRLNMELDADPTVQYAIAQDPASRDQYGWWKRDMTEQDLQVDSPYNTYQHLGLPPGPICNPGLPSIRAAINPEQNDYLYFVAKPDGSHVFAQTYDEHLHNIQLYRQ